MEKISLEQVKKNHAIQATLLGKSVRVYSNEHFMYWRPAAAGYTPDGLEAGVWQFEDAFRMTKHCSPQKQIEFRIC